jgi:hypothetical protein
MTHIELDKSKLLGFRIDADDQTSATSARIGDKQGAKLGAKIGAKEGKKAAA